MHRFIEPVLINVKLESALNFGAEGTNNSSKSDFISESRRLTDSEGADLIVKAIGGNHIPAVLAKSIPIKLLLSYEAPPD